MKISILLNLLIIYINSVYRFLGGMRFFAVKVIKHKVYKQSHVYKRGKEGVNWEEKIARINELYHKSKKEGLTEEEKVEQAKLRAEYIASVRGNLKAQLDNISIQNPDGTITDLGEKYGNKVRH